MRFGQGNAKLAAAITTFSLPAGYSGPNALACLSKANIRGDEFGQFLEHLTQKIPGEWAVVWDGNHIHTKCKVVKAWLARHARVVVEDFPQL